MQSYMATASDANSSGLDLEFESTFWDSLNKNFDIWNKSTKHYPNNLL